MGNDDKLDVIIARIDRMEDKLDKVQDGIGTLNIEVSNNSKDLEYHILRTNTLEKIVELEKQRIALYEGEINNKIEDLEAYPKYIKATLKIVAAIASVLGLVLIVQGLLNNL
jgi:uncharacterized protein YaiL (DUF2058 family)